MAIQAWRRVLVKEFFHFAGNAVKNAAPWSSPGESSADSGEDELTLS